MKCSKCGKYEATTNIRRVVNGVVIEKNLCSICAAKEGLDLTPQSSLAGMLASMFGDTMVLEPKNEKCCPVCGSSFSKIAESGKAGCADCYKTFKAELLPYLKRVHGSTKHIGKAPGNIPKNDTIEGLRQELNRLVSEEKYEQAAVLRDKIRQLEATGNE